MIAALLLASSLHAAVIFEESPRQTICKDGAAWERSFNVARDCSASVEIMQIDGVTREHTGEARFWLDDTLLGPIRREFGTGGWESVEPVFLKAGRHALSIECGDEAFDIEDVRVGFPGPAQASSPPPRSATVPPTTPGAVSALEQATSEPFYPFQPCPDLRANTGWPHSDPRRSILLSVLDGRAASSGTLTTLHVGERVRWWFKIAPRPGAIHFPPILLSEIQIEKNVWALQFSVDHEEMSRAIAKKKEGYLPQPLGYRPGKWTPLDLGLCHDGKFHLATNNGEVNAEIPVPDTEMEMEIRSREIEIEIVGTYR